MAPELMIPACRNGPIVSAPVRPVSADRPRDASERCRVSSRHSMVSSNGSSDVDSLSREFMISFDVGAHRFQFRAALVIVRDGHVLLHQIEGQNFWCLPGGRVEPGERAAHTVVREMREEVGSEIQVGKMLWSVENFFRDGERPHHEIGLYFTRCLNPNRQCLT